MKCLILATALVLCGIVGAQPRDPSHDITVVVWVDARYLATDPFTAIAKIVRGVADTDRIRATWKAGAFCVLVIADPDAIGQVDKCVTGWEYK